MREFVGQAASLLGDVGGVEGASWQLARRKGGIVAESRDAASYDAAYREQSFATHSRMVLRPAGSRARSGVAVEHLGASAVAPSLADVGRVVAARRAGGLRDGGLSPRCSVVVVGQAVDIDRTARPVSRARVVAPDASQCVDRAKRVAAGCCV